MGGKVGFFDEATEIIQEEAGQAAQTVKQQVTGKSGSQVQNTQGQKLPQVPQQQPPAGHASETPPETPGPDQPQDDSGCRRRHCACMPGGWLSLRHLW